MTTCWKPFCDSGCAHPPVRPVGTLRQAGRVAGLLLAIALGVPFVVLSAALSGEFVAQMLNLDCIDAISFNKGCYTGQEVIARAHYRGRVKRRLQRFATQTVLQPGASGHLQDGRAFRVVDAVVQNGGGCEFLAVVPLAHNDEVGTAADADATRIIAEDLPLPYALPD